MKVFLFSLGFLLVAAAGMAQVGGYTIYPPGQPPTMVLPDGPGGYTIYPPGQPPTMVLPDGPGGYTIYPPGGQPPTMVLPASPPLPPVQTAPQFGNDGLEDFGP
jgi:hypothetical protein